MPERRVSKSRKLYAVIQSPAAVRDYCTDLLWDIAPATPGETVKAWLHRAAVATGLKASTVKRLRYQEVPTVPAHIAFLLQDVAARQLAARQRAETLKAQNEEMLAEIRAGGAVVRRPAAGCGGVDAEAASATEDTRQLELPFHGWMK